MKKSKKIVYSIVIAGILFLVYIFIEPYLLHVNTITFANENVPASFVNKKIIFVSDIHNGPGSLMLRIRMMVTKINKLKPDIVIFGGDYTHTSPAYIEPCFQELKKINARYGKFGILGNHDYWNDAKLTRQNMQKADITVLDPKGSVWVKINNDTIKIAGVGGLFEHDFSSTIRDIKKNDFVLLVTHSPDYVERISTDKIDLVLSGHTHGGQFTILGLWAPFVPSEYGQKYRVGFVYTKYTTVFITTGVGTIGPPIRFFARPEIVELILLKGSRL